jgi:hypothetical protein
MIDRLRSDRDDRWDRFVGGRLVRRGAYVPFLAGVISRAFSYRPGNVRDGAVPAVFGVEEKLVSITRSAKLYSTTGAVLRRWED